MLPALSLLDVAGGSLKHAMAAAVDETIAAGALSLHEEHARSACEAPEAPRVEQHRAWHPAD